MPRDPGEASVGAPDLQGRTRPHRLRRSISAVQSYLAFGAVERFVGFGLQQCVIGGFAGIGFAYRSAGGCRCHGRAARIVDQSQVGEASALYRHAVTHAAANIKTTASFVAFDASFICESPIVLAGSAIVNTRGRAILFSQVRLTPQWAAASAIHEIANGVDHDHEIDSKWNPETSDERLPDVE